MKFRTVKYLCTLPISYIDISIQTHFAFFVTYCTLKLNGYEIVSLHRTNNVSMA